jgi:hypothetical protein
MRERLAFIAPDQAAITIIVPFRGASLTAFTERRVARLAPSALQVRVDRLQAFSFVW